MINRKEPTASLCSLERVVRRCDYGVVAGVGDGVLSVSPLGGGGRTEPSSSFLWKSLVEKGGETSSTKDSCFGSV